jgi:flagellar biosynthesis/type III secretory pathway protein FliH
MITTEQLETKISQLTTKVDELRKQSDIDPLSASPEQIIKNAQEEQQARESAEQLELVIQKLRSQLAECREQEQQAQIREHCAAGFQALVEQSDRVEQAIANLDTELKKLREMGRAIASVNMATTGRLALDDRISQNYRLPTIEKLNNSIIIHTESRKTVKRID